MEKSEGFPPIARFDARVLVLGSLPSERSIAQQQYYAHPQNAFWRIMRDVFGIEGDYAVRCDSLIAHRVAVWDVLKRSVRPGSMDADIRLDTAEVNDFIGFFEKHRSLGRVLCNGRTAGQLFLKRVLPELRVEVPVEIMPSTSPAYASMPYDVKSRIWRVALTGSGDNIEENGK